VYTKRVLLLTQATAIKPPAIKPPTENTMSQSTFTTTLEAINSNKSAFITLRCGGFTFVNHTTGQEEHHAQGGLECRWSFSLKRAYFIRDGVAWVAVNSAMDNQRFKAQYKELEAIANKAHKYLKLSRKELIYMHNQAYDEALSFALVVER